MTSSAASPTFVSAVDRRRFLIPGALAFAFSLLIAAAPRVVAQDAAPGAIPFEQAAIEQELAEVEQRIASAPGEPPSSLALEKEILERARKALAREASLQRDEAALAARAAAVEQELARVRSSPVEPPTGVVNAERVREAEARIEPLESALAEHERAAQEMTDLPAQLREDREGVVARLAEAERELVAWQRQLAVATPTQRPIVERRVAILRLAREASSRRLPTIDRRLAYVEQVTPVLAAERELHALRLDRARERLAALQEELDRRADTEEQTGVAGVTRLSLEREPLEQELAAVRAAASAASTDDARARLGREVEVLERALGALQREVEAAERVAGLEARRLRAEAQATEVPSPRARVDLPDPFTKAALDEALAREQELRKLLAEREQRLKSLEATPESLRQGLRTLQDEQSALQLSLEALTASEAAAATLEQKDQVRRQIALTDLEVKERDLRRRTIESSIDLARRQLPIARLELNTLARQLERQERIVRDYQAKHTEMLSTEVEAAEQAHQERLAAAAALREEGVTFRALRVEAEALVKGEAVERVREGKVEASWRTRLREVERDSADLAQRAKTETELLARQQSERARQRTESHVVRLGQLTAEARARYREMLTPWLAEAFLVESEARAKLDHLAEVRRDLARWYDDSRRAGGQAFREQHVDAEGQGSTRAYQDPAWRAEAVAWDRLKAERIQVVAEREGALQQLVEHLERFEELVLAEAARLAEDEALVRAKSFWLRGRAIIDSSTLAPAWEEAQGWLAQGQAGVRDGSLVRSTLGALGRPWTVGRFLLLVGALVLLVGVQRRGRRWLAPRFATDPPTPISLRAKLRRSGWRLLEALLLLGPWMAGAALFEVLFPGPLAWMALLVALVATGQAFLATLVRVLVRPHEPAWRIVPIDDDMASVAFRFLRIQLAVTTAWLGLAAAVSIFGATIASELRAALELVHDLVVTTAAIVVLTTSPALVGRLLSLISRRMAERVQSLLVPFGLFVGGSVIVAFALEALGFANAAESVRKSFFLSLGAIALGLLLDRLLYHVLVQRLDPHGVEEASAPAPKVDVLSATSVSLAAFGAAPGPGDPGGPAPDATEELDPTSPEARRALLRQFVGTAVSLVVLAGVIWMMLVAYQVEARTLRTVLGYPLLVKGADRVLTPGSLVACAITLFLTWLAYRYFRAFTAIYLLPRFGLSRGARFAISTVAGYMIVGAGTMVALNQLHIYIGDFEWFLAAAGVGIGFGLQEILSNFVSGLIILIERPVEVGDVVTVDGLQGQITKITIRSTTVLTTDNISMIVPNKSFITASVTNWTHDSPEVRVRIPVPVAYGSNVNLVKQTLMEVALSYGRIMRKPGPTVAFIGFGASSLDFELAVWVPEPTPAYRRRVISDLCSSIDAAFRRMGLQVPFNQIDVHLRESDALKLVTARERRGQNGGGDGVGAAEKDPEAEARERLKQKALEKRARKTNTSLQALKVPDIEL